MHLQIFKFVYYIPYHPKENSGQIKVITIQIGNLDNIFREVASFLVLFEAILKYVTEGIRLNFYVAPKEGWAVPKLKKGPPLINNDST